MGSEATRFSEGAGMNLYLKSVLVGVVLTGVLVSVAIAAGKVGGLEAFGSLAVYLLTPGIVLGFAVGSGHVHDTSFWVLTAILNALIFSLLAAPCILLFEKLRSRNPSVKGTWSRLR